MVARDLDVAALRRAVCAARFVTLTGVGGVGKTRLAAEVLPGLAEDLGQRFVAVDCEGVATADGLRGVISSTMGVAAGGASWAVQVAAACDAKPVLLVLDGCEQLAGSAAGCITDLLARSDALRVVATSRVPLASPHEQVLRLRPFDVDGTVAATTDVRALMEAAGRRAHPGFTLTADDDPVVVDVCRMVDGLPLGIELAGARAATVGLQALRDGLAAAPETLDDCNSDDRRSLQGVLRWTYRTLQPDAALLLGHLALAPGPVDLRLAQALALPGRRHRVAAVLDQLVQSSLLVAVTEPPRPSYRILGLVRRFARQQLTRRGARRGGATTGRLGARTGHRGDGRSCGPVGPQHARRDRRSCPQPRACTRAGPSPVSPSRGATGRTPGRDVLAPPATTAARTHLADRYPAGRA